MINRFIYFLAGMVVVSLCVALVHDAFALEGNKRRGQVYFKKICTACHVESTGKPIPPNTKTIAEWRAYMKADKHAQAGKANPSIRYYASQEYRKSVQDQNKAAKKFLALPDEQIYLDVLAYVVYGAKDSDTPLSCQ